MKKILGIILCFIMVMSLTLQVAAIRSIPIKKINLSKTSITLEVGKTYNLNYTLSPANNTQKKLVYYMTANKLIATVDKNAKITAVSPGTTTVTVYGPKAKVKAACTVTVVKPEPYAFSIFRSTWTTLNEDTDPVIMALNKKFNIKIKILTAPYETWAAKYGILVSSGQVPDLSITTGPGTMSFNAWCKQGIYMDITSLYQKYCPNIQKYVSDDVINAHKINGKLYGIPKPSLSDSTYAIRTDWLKKLNLTMPKTLDELINVVQAFKDKDPDGNGENDTYGFVSEDTLNVLGIIFGAYGCSVTPIATSGAVSWIPDGKGGLKANLLASGMKEAIVKITELYRNKTLDQEWMLTKSQALSNKVWSGKVGFTPTSFQNMISETEAKTKLNDPDCTFGILDGVTAGPGYTYAHPMKTGFYMVSSISSKVKNPQKILEFVDYLMTDEGDTLIRYGIEGLTYAKLANGKILPDKDELIKYNMGNGHAFRQIMQPPKISIAGEDPRIPSLLEGAKVLFKGPYYPAPTIQLPSIKEVAAKQGGSYIQNAITAIVTGSGDPAAAWDKFIAEWKATGGDKLTQEANEIYLARD